MTKKGKQIASHSRSYVVWNRDMDAALANVLYDQMNQGLKVDGTWKPQVYQVAVDALKSFNSNLNKDNVKNRLKIWKTHYNVIYDIKNKSGLTWWDDEKKMVIIPASEQKVWNDYVTANPDAKGYQNRLIKN
ncbi:uncharacterized protein LOC109847561 [Asparagus officinalis]|uniref:uncharacterized protein LOC109847561 n=1 Tax=Asparagus officinalis TaxID=4686 RepID=UPI00098DF49B|nr:uncharacterized protein LOC109847561 [Asparagus officinalis]